MKDALRETTAHGSRDFPFALYHMHRLKQPCAFSLHWHDEVEFIYVQQGQLNLTIEESSYLGKAGDIFVVNSREIHEMSVTVTPTVYITALFPLSSLLFRREDAISQQYLMPLLENRLRFPRQVTCEALLPRLRGNLDRLAELSHRNEDCYMLKIRVLLLQILCDFFSEDCLLPAAQDSRFKTKHRAILGYINDNFLRGLTLDEVAGEFHMVPKYFSRYFKSTFHVSFTDYVNHLRLEQAADMLRHTELSVTEIALRTGFNSSSYFNKKFRSVYRKTPSEYRTVR